MQNSKCFLEVFQQQQEAGARKLFHFQLQLLTFARCCWFFWWSWWRSRVGINFFWEGEVSFHMLETEEGLQSLRLLPQHWASTRTVEFNFDWQWFVRGQGFLTKKIEQISSDYLKITSFTKHKLNWKHCFKNSNLILRWASIQKFTNAQFIKNFWS